MRLVRLIWERINERGLSNEQICYIIREIESIREIAGQQLLKQNPTKKDLVCIIKHIESESLRQKAVALLEQIRNS